MPLLAALALLSATTTAQQIALMQILGWIHGHHFAYLVVALALLGFGFSGTVLSIARVRLLQRAGRLIPWLLLATTLSIPLGLRLAQLPAFAVDLPLLFFNPAQHAWRLVALCLLLLPPFFFAGLATALILTTQARHAGRFYAASLAGAGLGGLLGLAGAAFISPPQLPTAVALLAFAAFACSRKQERADRPHQIPALLTAAFLLTSFFVPPDLALSQFKPLRRTLDLPDAHIIASRPSLHGWIQIVDAPALRPSPPTSLHFIGEIPRQPAVFINALPYGSLLDPTATRNPHWLAATTDAAAFLHSPQRILLLENALSGWAAFATHTSPHARITVIEPNSALADLLTSAPAPLAPEWTLPSVNLTHAHARSFLRRTSESFDLIRFPDVGALGGTAGLASATEQFLLTRDAFTDAFHRLAPGGILAVTAWMDFPERNSLRLLATLVETAEAAHIPPRTHLVALRGWASVTFLLRNQPWTPAQLATFRTFASDQGFDPLLLPDLEPFEREQHHAWQNPDFFRLVDRLVDGPREPLYRDHPLQLRPATDTRPYFSQFLRLTQLPGLTGSFGAHSVPFFELGSLTIAVTLVLLLALAVACIILPLFRLGWKTPGKLRIFLYFAALGTGFMTVEIAFILQAHALLGSPILAASAVITALLIAAGFGSLFSEKLPALPRTQTRLLIPLCALLLLTSFLLPALSRLAQAAPAALQLTLLLLLILPLGFLMGQLFPLALRRLESTTPAHIPWAWAINGCLSVATPAAATLLAITFGFPALLLAAGLVYALALLSTVSAAR